MLSNRVGWDAAKNPARGLGVSLVFCENVRRQNVLHGTLSFLQRELDVVGKVVVVLVASHRGVDTDNTRA